jgi:hypothetical protein
MLQIIKSKIFLIIVGFVIVLVLGTHILLRFFAPPNNNSSGDPSTKGVRVQGNTSIPETDEYSVVYTDSGFNKSEVTIANGQFGCIAQIFNRSSQDFYLGLSPHKESGDPGRAYDALAPQNSLVFDPRFSGYTELTYHSHKKPEHQIVIKFDKSCQVGVQ